MLSAKDASASSSLASAASTRPSDVFARRHLGPRASQIPEMLQAIGLSRLDELAEAVIPASIRAKEPLVLEGLPDEPMGEAQLLGLLREIAAENSVHRSYLGQGYHDVIVPGVIQRGILESPGWYTQYTPYQAEISQGRLEALLNFQTMVSDLTGLPLANASLLDEATAGAEALGLCRSVAGAKKRGFFVSSDCHPQTIGVIRTRAEALGITLHVGDPEKADFAALECCGVVLQYPASDGRVFDPRPLIERAHAAGALACIAADLLALTLLTPPGELGADLAFGTTQRFGVPMGFGGPHAAYFATSEEHARRLPGRLVGISKDRNGKLAYRLAIQTREQHIRREKATSNICTAQVLLAIMASMYAVYHGPEGLTRTAKRIRFLTAVLALGLRKIGHEVVDFPFFDTLRVRPRAGLNVQSVLSAGWEREMNFRTHYRRDTHTLTVAGGGAATPNPEGRPDGSVGIALDETTTREDVEDILEAFANDRDLPFGFDDLVAELEKQGGVPALPESLVRRSAFLTHPVFHRHHSETEMLRYIHRLQAKDLSLTTSMIPLGSCTMKLNATVEMIPVTWPEFGRLHPYAPADQAAGYSILFEQLETWLGQITGLPAVSLQPNAGSQGEYAGLLAIRRYFQARGETERDVCLIPVSAHGTNASSAVVAGFRCVAVKCDARGNIDVGDLRQRVAEHADRLGALMITYPSTHGVFEESVREICSVVHDAGAQVYMDGANMNAQVGLTSPAAIGADVCHLNLHKTFSIPHGGGGPGMGPICAGEHLRDFLPGHPVFGESPVSAAPFGSASILPISWTYIALMGGAGLTRATQLAILNANYMARRLAPHFEILYSGPGGRVAHEFIIDCRPFEKSAGVTVEDIAKRLMDYGFHAPTMSFPVVGTLMIEPTESESKEELDRLCDALIGIREEIRAIERGEIADTASPLKFAPHPADIVCADAWPFAYTRTQAAYPAPWTRIHKFWPPVSRIDNAYGDRNLVCTCPPLEELVEP
ncbi:MAG: aminomethyl-transferring glycine dehydrogenase [Deltaproteobacteria bacterium]|nr:aminomethyl-transferring glycine dehydrogenase [Deltaproteobacteria bacterium]